MKSRTFATQMVVLLFVLSACTFNNETPLPISTIPFATIQPIASPQETLFAVTTTPTSIASQTAENTSTPTLQPKPTATRTPRPNPTKYVLNSCNNSVFVKSVTIPDGTHFAPGVEFRKIWQIKNNGTCTWKSKTYKFVLVKGDAIGADDHKLVFNIAPGEIMTIPIDMTAPLENGTYKGYWQLQDPAGVLFGEIVIVKIVVKS